MSLTAIYKNSCKKAVWQAFVNSVIFMFMPQVRVCHRRYFLTTNMCQSQAIYRVTTYLENLEMSGNLTAVREISGKCQGKKFVIGKLPKTVYCKLHICVHGGI